VATDEAEASRSPAAAWRTLREPDLARVDLGDPTGFEFSGRSGAGSGVRMGEQAPAGSRRLEAQTAEPARIRLLRGGRVVAEADGQTLAYDADAPGAHRVEVLRYDRGRLRRWIVSNPIYLR
jgi:hypothetical protein